jgi:hypothetical protein
MGRTEWLFLMFGRWLKHDTIQRLEAKRRFQDSELL